LKPEHMKRYPHQFSGGQRQRIGIARALALDPKLIICDEPVTALDVSVQAQVLNLLNNFKKRFGFSYLLIAHDLSVIKHLSDRIAVMYLGKIVELSANEDLFKNPKHPYTEALISAVPITDPGRKGEKIILKGDVPSPVDPPRGCYFHPRCLYSQSICRSVEPKFQNFGRTHKVSCHFADSLKLNGIK
jgi:oligopeptide/dipeptide ABC transporter ATP-binding protein